MCPTLVLDITEQKISHLPHWMRRMRASVIGQMLQGVKAPFGGPRGAKAVVSVWDHKKNDHVVIADPVKLMDCLEGRCIYQYHRTIMQFQV